VQRNQLDLADRDPLDTLWAGSGATRDEAYSRLARDMHFSHSLNGELRPPRHFEVTAVAVRQSFRDD
jgi:hypothetical protein